MPKIIDLNQKELNQENRINNPKKRSLSLNGQQQKQQKLMETTSKEFKNKNSLELNDEKTIENKIFDKKKTGLNGLNQPKQINSREKSLKEKFINESRTWDSKAKHFTSKYYNLTKQQQTTTIPDLHPYIKAEFDKD